MNDLGAQQKSSFKKDFEKLNSAQADYKFFFVTDDKAFKLMRERYASQLQNVTIANLVTEEEYVVDTTAKYHKVLN